MSVILKMFYQWIQNYKKGGGENSCIILQISLCSLYQIIVGIFDPVELLDILLASQFYCIVSFHFLSGFIRFNSFLSTDVGHIVEYLKTVKAKQHSYIYTVENLDKYMI